MAAMAFGRLGIGRITEPRGRQLCGQAPAVCLRKDAHDREGDREERRDTLNVQQDRRAQRHAGKPARRTLDQGDDDRSDDGEREQKGQDGLARPHAAATPPRPSESLGEHRALKVTSLMEARLASPDAQQGTPL